MKPADIPQGVWDAADRVLTGPEWNPSRTEAIARAIMADREENSRRIAELEREVTGLRRSYFDERKKVMADREACAAISDEYVNRDGNDAWARGYRSAGAGISQDIRSRP